MIVLLNCREPELSPFTGQRLPVLFELDQMWYDVQCGDLTVDSSTNSYSLPCSLSVYEDVVVNAVKTVETSSVLDLTCLGNFTLYMDDDEV